jgi:large subunit ribosomal protein L10
MAITRQKKEVMWKEVEGIADSSKSIVFVGFKGLTVADATVLRRGLSVQGVGYRVVKKRIAAKVIAGKKVSGTMPKLVGQVGLAYLSATADASDITLPPREVFTAGKKLDGKISILGGIFDGAYKNASEMSEIAMIPGVTTLRGMFVNVINSPIQGLVIALDAIAKKKEA